LTAILTEATDLFNVYKLGITRKDKIIIFTFIVNFFLVIFFLFKIFGEKKGYAIYNRKSWLLDWTPGKNAMVNRNGIILSTPVKLNFLYLLKSDYEKYEYDFINNLSLTENSVVLDIGSNIGLYTIFFARLCPKLKKIISVEASPPNFKKLNINCKLNNVSNVSIYNLVVSGINDQIVDFYEEGAISSTQEKFLTNLGFSEQKLQKIEMKTITIDRLIEKEKIDQISLLKIDIEGAEVEALNGASNALKQQKIKNMIIEYHSNENKNKILDMLKSNYKLDEDIPRRVYTGNSEMKNGHILATLKNINFS